MPSTHNRPRYKIAVPPRTTPAPVYVVPTRRLWVGPVWGIAGFALGVAVWHTLGFWDFVGRTVLKGPDEDERRMIRGDAPATSVPANRATGTIHGPKVIVAGYPHAVVKAHLACSVAIPDADEETTSVSPCPPGTLPPPLKPLARKTDFGWPARDAQAAWGATVRPLGR